MVWSVCDMAMHATFHPNWRGRCLGGTAVIIVHSPGLLPAIIPLWSSIHWMQTIIHPGLYTHSPIALSLSTSCSSFLHQLITLSTLYTAAVNLASDLHIPSFIVYSSLCFVCLRLPCDILSSIQSIVWSWLRYPASSCSSLTNSPPQCHVRERKVRQFLFFPN